MSQMNRLQNRPFTTNTSGFYAGAETQITKQPRFDGISAFDNRDYDQATEAPVNHHLRMRCAYEDTNEYDENATQLYGMARYDCLFPCAFGTKTEISNIGVKTFTLQGINRYLHEAKLQRELEIKDGQEHPMFDYDGVYWFKQYMSFHGILNDDKSAPRPWGEMEKTAVVLTQGMTRIPSMFNKPEIPPYTRMGFMVKDVCIGHKPQYYVTDMDQVGVRLQPPADGWVTRVIPVAMQARYPRLYCEQCGRPDDETRVFFDNCIHKEDCLLYEVPLNENMESGGLEKELIRLNPGKAAEIKNVVKGSRSSLKEFMEKLNTISIRKAHFIPFAMAERGLTKTAFEPNIYRSDSEINEVQYQLNSHEEIWLRAP